MGLKFRPLLSLDRLEAHHDELPTLEAQWAVEIAKSLASRLAVENLDCAADTACKIAAQLTAEFRARGWLVSVPEPPKKEEI